MRIIFVMWLVLVLTVVHGGIAAQDTTSLREVLVSALRDEPARNTSIHIEPMSLREVENTAVFNLSDAVSQIPGVTQLSTGPAISKPVIRGLYGNRVLVLISGMRFDNQQWQDEHGLGLTDIGLSRVEVIKGPLSVLHGSEAVGGVINLVAEERAPEGYSQADAGIRMHSNTLGPLLQAGYKVNRGRSWFHLRLGAESHADYSDGNNTRVLNSRYNGMYGMASYGFVKNKWLSENRYYFSNNQFGFIFSDLSQFIEEDDRWSRPIEGPHHIVQLHLLSSENTFQMQRSSLKVNVGFQSNMRSEDEGGGKLSLQMHLMSWLATARWTRPLGEHSTLILASNSSLENNTNYGSRKIVPDAWMKESSVSAYMKHGFGKFILEYGAGSGWRNIQTRLTPTVNTAEKDIDPFTQDRYFANALAGLSWNPASQWNVKLNGATGVRAPNLAELSSNGLHEGIYTYELGDPGLDNEQNLNTDLCITRSEKKLRGYVSGFYNAIRDYIYLQPTGGDWFGFPVYHFIQQDAELYGGEVSLSWFPGWIKGVELDVNYSGLIGRLTNGEYLPYMPARQVTPGIRYNWKGGSGKYSGSVFAEANAVAAQHLTAPGENRTPAYERLNAGVSLHLKASRANYDFSLAGKNLLNETYYNHMSRLKNYGILNMGRNIIFQLRITFIKPLKNNK